MSKVVSTVAVHDSWNSLYRLAGTCRGQVLVILAAEINAAKLLFRSPTA